MPNAKADAKKKAMEAKIAHEEYQKKIAHLDADELREMQRRHDLIWGDLDRQSGAASSSTSSEDLSTEERERRQAEKKAKNDAWHEEMKKSSGRLGSSPPASQGRDEGQRSGSRDSTPRQQPRQKFTKANTWRYGRDHKKEALGKTARGERGQTLAKPPSGLMDKIMQGGEKAMGRKRADTTEMLSHHLLNFFTTYMLHITRCTFSTFAHTRCT